MIGKLSWAILGFLIILIGFFHLWQLGTLPRGLHNDEASIGYNAYLISTSGKDEHGFFLPLYFKAFGEYKNPLHVYTTAGLFTLFGVSETTLRLTSVVWFMAFVVILLLLIKDIFGPNPKIMIYSLVAAGFLPWFFPMSRIALEVVTQLTMVTLSLWLIYRTYTRSPQLSWLAGLALGLSIYSYSTSRLLLSLEFLALVLVYYPRKYWGMHLRVGLGVIIALLPYFFFSAAHPKALTARFSEVTYLYDSSLTSLRKAEMFANNYLHYLSPSYLLFKGDTTLRHHIGGSGEIYFSVVALALIALGEVFINSTYFKQNRYFVFLFLNLILAPLPAALTRGDSALRSVTVGLYIVLLSALGVASIARLLPKKVQTLVVGAFFILLLVEAGNYVHRYFTDYPAVTIGAMESYDFKATLASAIAYEPAKIIVSNKGIAPYIQLKFYELLLPHSNIPAIVSDPIAQVSQCIIYTPFGDQIDNPLQLPLRARNTGNFTKLACF